MDCPVSGGCHRAATGNISIFAGGTRAAFERVLPVLSILGQRILHTGPVGSASMLKVLTNYLCTVHLAALAEALTVAKVAGLDMNTTYEGIRISSGNSFVHETESQVILNGSRDINFTMDLVVKDVGCLTHWPGITRCRWSSPRWCSAYSGTVHVATASASFPEHHPASRGRLCSACPGGGIPGTDGRRRTQDPRLRGRATTPVAFIMLTS